MTIPNQTNHTSLIGGIGLTELAVYEQRPAPDGTNSGCPHIHAICDEAYYVIEGSGEVELHDLTNGFRSLALSPGQYVQFPPLVLHRIISHNKLRILGMMGNAGLAESGDARIYFGKNVDKNDAEFKRLTALPKEKGLEGALERRDHSVHAYQTLLQLHQENTDAYNAELQRFIQTHQNAIKPLHDTFQSAIKTGPSFWGARSLSRLQKPTSTHPDSNTVTHHRQPPQRSEYTTLGMCGMLNPMLTLQQID
jgi:mannose-6-phosphate isomerase-like protein (cupin superfamily)